MPQGLSSLSPELVVNILQCLCSPKDLYAIIKSSSQFYRVFAAYKQSILSAILLHAIPAEAETEFILAYRAQRIWKFVPESNDDVGRRTKDEIDFENLAQECVAVLDQFKSGKSGRLSELLVSSPLVSDRPRLMDIWKFYSSFEHLIISYRTRALSKLRQPSSESDSSGPLSFTEQTRLQRAFFLWEIYTCVFQISRVTGDDSRFGPPSTDPAPRFAAMLHPWEVEESFCVAQFYKVLMEELCDRIEEDFVVTVKEKMKTRAKAGLETDDPGGGLHMLDYHCLWWYEESYKRCHRSGHIDYLVSRGMRGVWKLNSAPLPIARKMVIRTDLESRPEAPRLLGLSYENPRKEGGRVVERYQGENDTDENYVGRCNFGWMWAGGDDSRINSWANYELRDLGYVFWDKSRLLEFDRFKSPREPVKSFFDFPPGFQKYSDRPGVEVKLRDTPIHSKVIQEIYKDIDGRPYHRDDNDNIVMDDGNARSDYTINWRD
ncbi:hypothetical protein FQN54_006074 [Arachnomyces sp. PD_36]|nr:hypothetical protein FQN54_006074 [Arachnomyces sp. PD_36]